MGYYHKNHMQIHDEDFSCPVCNDKFKWRSNLQKHMFIHATLDASHVCHICPKKFMWKYNLQAHLLTHQAPTHNTSTPTTADHTPTSNGSSTCDGDIVAHLPCG